MRDSEELNEQEKKAMQEVANNDLLMKVRSQILCFSPDSKKVKPMFEEANTRYPNKDIDKINAAADRENAAKDKNKD